VTYGRYGKRGAVVNRYSQPKRKTTIWLGSDDGDPGGMNGYGYDVHPEDSMVSIEYAGCLGRNGEELQVFILPDLFPAVRKAMDVIEARQPGRKRKAKSKAKGDKHGGRADGGRPEPGEAAQDPGHG
jgi:hypothetical protein